MKIIKKNQLTILVLALMLVTAGYLNYNSNQSVTTESKIASIGDATLVSSNSIVSNNNIQDNVSSNTTNNIVSNSNLANNTIENTENSAEETNSDVKDTDYYTSSKIERDTMYSEMLESYQKILDSSTTSSAQKEEAQKEITTINNTKNSIMISENLIKTKGFEDCLIYVNDDSISIVVKKETLNKEDTAQIQSIIAREMNAKLENIHIMTK